MLKLLRLIAPVMIALILNGAIRAFVSVAKDLTLPLAAESVKYLNLRMHRDVLALSTNGPGWQVDIPFLVAGVLFTIIGIWLTLSISGKSGPGEPHPIP